MISILEYLLKEKLSKEYIAKAKRALEFNGKYDPESKKGKKLTFDNIDIGDILVSTFGYNSRHVNFWKVCNKIGKSTIEVLNVDDEIVSGSYNGTGKVMPNFDRISNKPIKARFFKNVFKINGNYTYFWNGEPEEVYSD